MTPNPTMLYDSLVAIQIDSSGTQLHCSCPYSRRMRFNWGVSYCSHIQKVILQRRDEIADVPLTHTVVVTSSPPPLSRPFALQFSIGSPESSNGNQREVRLLELNGESIGFVHGKATRLDVIELAVPYLVEWYYRHPCEKCGVIEPLGADDDLDEGQLHVARLAAERLARQSQDLCADCRSLVPEVPNDRKYPTRK